MAPGGISRKSIGNNSGSSGLIYAAVMSTLVGSSKEAFIESNAEKL